MFQSMVVSPEISLLQSLFTKISDMYNPNF